MRRLIEIRPGEGRSAGGAFLVLFGVMSAHTLIETARDALFLARLPAERLPWVYLAIAAIGLAISRFGGSKRKSGSLSVTLLVCAGATAGFWALCQEPTPALLYALYVYSGLFASWVIVRFWLELGNLFTVVQAKRLFGAIGAGSVLGAVVGAGIATVLSQSLASRHLLLTAAAILALTAVGPTFLLGSGSQSDVAPAPIAAGRTRSFGEDVSELFSHAYTKRILFLVLISTIALTTVDFVFKQTAVAYVPRADLGRFFALVYLVLNSIALVIQLGAVGLLLRTLGVQRTALIMPIALLVSAGGLVAGGALVAAIVLKGVDGVLRHSVHRTGTELLFVPIEDAVRARVKPMIDLIGQRGGQAVASLAILGLAGVGMREFGFGLVIVGLCAAWVFVAGTIQRHYLDLFRENLRSGRIDYEGDLPELDLAALEALFAGLNSERDAEVLASLELLAAQKRQRLIPALLLYHPSRRVVLKALEVFSSQRRQDFIPIAQRLLSHAEPEVRAAALRAWAAVTDDEAFLRGLLGDTCLEVRATALVSLISRGLMPDDESERALDELAKSAEPGVRTALARAIGEQPSSKLAPTLEKLAESPEPEVLADVAWAMGRTRDLRFLPRLLRMLEFRIQGAAAADALVELAGPALEMLDRALADPDLPVRLRRNLPRAIARFEPSIAAPILLAHLESADDGMLRFRLLVALKRLRAFDPTLSLDAAKLSSVAEDTIRSAFRSLAWRITIEEGAARDPKRKTAVQALIVGLLKDKEAHALSRLFRALSLIHPGESFERIQRGLIKGDAKAGASSRELIENLIATPIRDGLLALIEDLSDAERLARAPAAYRPEPIDYDALVDHLLERGGELGTLAAYHAAELGRSAVARSQGGDDALGRALASRAAEIGRVAHA